jgi:16S rRNA C967 or C1407 C5-methylase (RsmB/RsmF family)
MSQPPSAEDSEEGSRYRSVLHDWQAFERGSPEPSPCILAHPGRLDRARLTKLLRADGISADAVGWHPLGLRLPAGSRPGLAWPFRVGLYQIQEEASLLPVQLLDPQPGERVLDLCAAPGGKTAQIALAMAGTGSVVANDRNGRRLVAVREKVKRLGLLNVSTSVCNGCAFPLEAGSFDRVLVDAPCSAEREAGNAGSGGRPSYRLRIAQSQRDLLRRALALCRPGGRVVYSTCSLAPEEDEAVVDALLRARPGVARVLPLRVPGLRQAPGLRQWRGARYLPELRHALRLWPHRSGTAGFFAVALERIAGQSEAPGAAADSADFVEIDAELRRRVAGMTQRFGLPESSMSQLRLVRRGQRELHAVARSLAPPATPAASSAGIPFAKLGALLPKPTTAAALLLGGLATRNILEVDADQAADYLSLRPVTPRTEQLASCDRSGFVILRRDGLPLGAGLLRKDVGRPVVESTFPHAWVPMSERAEHRGPNP